MAETPAQTRRGVGSRQEELLAAAAVVFANVGFRDATMEAIAAEGGSTKQTVYSRFGSKEALYRDCVERETRIFRDHMNTVSDAIRTLRIAYRLRAATSGFFQYVENNRVGFTVLLARQASDPGAPRLSAVEDILLDGIAADIREFCRQHGVEFGPSIDQIAAMMLGLVVTAARRCLLTGSDFTTASELAGASIVQIARIDPALAFAFDAANTR